jgi:hypothetical protein
MLISVLSWQAVTVKQIMSHDQEDRLAISTSHVIIAGMSYCERKPKGEVLLLLTKCLQLPSLFGIILQLRSWFRSAAVILNRRPSRVLQSDSHNNAILVAVRTYTFIGLPHPPDIKFAPIFAAVCFNVLLGYTCIFCPSYTRFWLAGHIS